MAKFCNNCGSELPDDALNCSYCGTDLNNTEFDQPTEAQSAEVEPAVQDAPATPSQEQPEAPKKKKGKWWLIPVAAVLAVVMAGAFLWKPLLLKFAPQVYLSMATNKTIKMLSERSEGSPVALLGTAVEYMNDGTMDVELEYNDEYSGENKIGMSVSSDVEAKKWAINADISSMGEDMDLDMYMDADFLALRSSLIAEGKYYGLTYDTFEEDIRKSAFGEMLSDDQIQQLDEVVQMLDDSIDQTTDYAKLMEPYIKLMEEYVKNLEVSTGSDKLELDDKQQKCDTIAYTLEEDELFDLLDEMLDTLEDDEDLKEMFLSLMSSIAGETADIEASWSEMIDELRESLNDVDEEVDAEGVLTYYIHSTSLTAISFDIELSGNGGVGEVNADMLLTFGKDPSKGDIVLDMDIDADGQEMELSLVSDVEKSDDTYKSTLTITGAANGGPDTEVVLKTKWNRDSGDLTFDISSVIDGETFNTDFTIKLLEKTDGIEIAVDDVYALMVDIDESFDDYNESFECSFSIGFSKGSSIETPDYINLDQINEDVITEAFGNIGLGGEDEWAVEDDYLYSEDFYY